MPKKISNDEDSDDIPLLGERGSPDRPRRSFATAKPKYKLESSSDEKEEEEDEERDGEEQEEDGDDDDGSANEGSDASGNDDSENEENDSDASSEKEKKKRKKNGRVSKASADSDDDVVDVSSPPRKKADQKSSPPERSEFSDSDEEKRFLQLMKKYSPAKPKSEPKAKSGTSTSADKRASAAVSSPTAKAKKTVMEADEERVEPGSRGGEATAGRSSKIKFSRSVPLIVANPKRIGRTGFIVQVDHILEAGWEGKLRQAAS
jgi:hypothetical protein